MKAKTYWLASSTGMLKNVLHKSITVKNLLSVGMDVSRVQALGIRGYQGIDMLFIAQGS